MIRGLKVKSLDSIGQYGALELRRVFPLACSNETLVDIFVSTAEQNGFLITEKCSDKVSAVKEFHNMFNCVVPTLHGAAGSSHDVIVNMSISANVKHDYKLLTVIGPKRPAMQTLIRALENALSSMSHFWVSRFSDSVKRDFRFTFEGSVRDGSSSSPISAAVAESTNQSYKTEEAAYYYFYKILMNRQYSIGNEVADFLNEFTMNFPSREVVTQEDDLDQSPTSDRHSVVSSKRFSVSDGAENSFSVPEWTPSTSSSKVINIIDQVVSQFDSNYLTLRNPSSALVDDLLPRLRPSIERFMFESTGKMLVTHYKKFFYDDDKKFVFKSFSIRGSLSGGGSHLGESCGIRRDFQFGFEKSITLFNDLQHAFDSHHTPNSILQRLLSILVSIKTEVLNGTKGSKELDSMDDIAPIFLFLVVSAPDLRTPNSIYHYLLDTMPQDQRMETEGRAVALLEGATRIVLSEWATNEEPGSASPSSSLID